MLDDANILKQRDPTDMLGSVSQMVEQLSWQPTIISPENDGRVIENIVIAGMGGSALAAETLKTVASRQLHLPVEIVKDYQLPNYVSTATLVITVSHSGNTEETLSCYHQARNLQSQIAVICGGGSLLARAKADSVAHVVIPTGAQPRMSTTYHLKALLAVFNLFKILGDDIAQTISSKADWLAEQIDSWHLGVPVHENYAKQLALLAAGKTPVIYGGPLTAALAYKWKISWNENAKNTAFTNRYPEFNHNEFVGWSSHPVEKPFIIFDLVSSFESARIHERMQLSDQLLSGLRPKANRIDLQGDDLIAQCLWGTALADMTSIYVAILNGVRPEPVDLVEKLKTTLS